MRVIPISTALAITLILSAFSAALASEWIVQKASPPARYSNDGVIWTPLAAGMVVPEGSTIFTGRRGRVMLRRDAETILFAPNTLAAIAKPNRSGFATEIVQRVGTLVLEVEKRERPHARVRTPFLAAVVKGTRFKVRVGRQSALVKVTDGVVEVTELSSSARSDVRARQTAIVQVASDKPLRVRGPGRKAPLTRVDPIEPVVKPLAVERNRAVSKPPGAWTRNVRAVAGRGRMQKPDVAAPPTGDHGGTDVEKDGDDAYGSDGEEDGGDGTDGGTGTDSEDGGGGTDGGTGTDGEDGGDGTDGGTGTDGEDGGGDGTGRRNGHRRRRRRRTARTAERAPAAKTAARRRRTAGRDGGTGTDGEDGGDGTDGGTGTDGEDGGGTDGGADGGTAATDGGTDGGGDGSGGGTGTDGE